MFRLGDGGMISLDRDGGNPGDPRIGTGRVDDLDAMGRPLLDVDLEPDAGTLDMVAKPEVEIAELRIVRLELLHADRHTEHAAQVQKPVRGVTAGVGCGEKDDTPD